MFFIAKLTGLNIKSSQNVNANLVQKYPLIWWCNLVLVSILSFSCWVYYIKCEGFSENLYGFLSRYSTPFFIIGTIVSHYIYNDNLFTFIIICIISIGIFLLFSLLFMPKVCISIIKQRMRSR